MASNNTKVAGYIRDMSGLVSDEMKPDTKNKGKDETIVKAIEDHPFDAIIVTNERGIIQGVNDTAVTEFGYEEKDKLVGKNISIIDSFLQDQLNDDDGRKQSVVKLTKKDGTEVKSIVASKKIKGSTSLFAIYIRNIDSLGSLKLD